ncbi:MAG TPA: twin-arginine translocase TatA/TatE family subunit [Myxococcaceae bacterium]|nr:twin-arginine translocase TatA/TatE family subunit [Myxococcaceae bacterium]
MVARVSFGLGEILIIVFILVLVFSASRMGQMGNALGKFVYSFKKAARGEDFVDGGRASTRLEQRRGPQRPEDASVVNSNRPKE